MTFPIFGTIITVKSHEITRNCTMPNAYPTEQAREAARQRIYDQDLTIREWADRNELDESTVYAVLNGQKKCLRGKARRVAILLGLRVAVISQ